MSNKTKRLVMSLLSSLEESGSSISLSMNDINISVKNGNVELHIDAKASVGEKTLNEVLDTITKKEKTKIEEKSSDVTTTEDS